MTSTTRAWILIVTASAALALFIFLCYFLFLKSSTCLTFLKSTKKDEEEEISFLQCENEEDFVYLQPPYEVSTPQPVSELNSSRRSSFSKHSSKPNLSELSKRPALFRQKSSYNNGLGWIRFSVSYDSENEFLTVCVNSLLDQPGKTSSRSRTLIILRLLPREQEIQSIQFSSKFVESHMIKVPRDNLFQVCSSLLFTVYSVDKREIHYPLGNAKVKLSVLYTALETSYMMQLQTLDEIDQRRSEGPLLNVGMEFDPLNRTIRIGIIALCNWLENGLTYIKDVTAFSFLLQTFQCKNIIFEQRSSLLDWPSSLENMDLYISQYLSVYIGKRDLNSIHFIILLVLHERINPASLDEMSSFPSVDKSQQSVKTKTRDVIHGWVRLGSNKLISDVNAIEHWNEALSSHGRIIQKSHRLKAPEFYQNLK